MNTQAKVYPRGRNGKLVHGEAVHGKETPEYRIWFGIIGRCTCPTNTSYPLYGGRGIKVCQRWLHSYMSFLVDMGRKPFPNYSIERIDNEGPYSKENCRWATRKEQARNTRTNQFITANGETLTHTEWSLRLGGHPSLVHSRIQHGWSGLDAVTRPKRRRS